MTVRTVSGPDILPFLDEVARLRIEVFREWPYLYDGSSEYEKKYLATFAKAPNACLVLALEGEKIMGASTGLPLARETWNIQKPFRRLGRDVQKIYYFAESVLQADCRGLGLGVRFFEEREAFAHSIGSFEELAFCGVVRPDDHPLRPENWQPLDHFWQKRGFKRADGLVCEIAWRDLDEATETKKPLQFWTKKV